jgi:hypothetical protein
MSHVDISHVVYLPTYPTALPTYIVASHVLAYFRQSDWSETSRIWGLRTANPWSFVRRVTT